MKAIPIFVCTIILMGVTKMFLWPSLWNNKGWWMDFNKWYYIAMLGMTGMVIVLYLVGIFRRKK